MKKVLVSPAHYIVSTTSTSEFYFAGELLTQLSKKEGVEYHIICGYFENKENLGKNIRIHELYKKPKVELNIKERLKFYFWTLYKSTILCFGNKFDTIWHLLPNGKYSFNLFIFLKLHKLLGIKRTVIGKLGCSTGEVMNKTWTIEKNSVKSRNVKHLWVYKAFYKILGFFSKYYFRSFDKLVFYNKTCYGNLKSFLGKSLKKEKIVIIPTGIDEKKFKPKQKNFTKPINFLFLGNLIELKRVDKAIDICAGLNNQKINFNFDIVGDGNMRKSLEEKVKKLKLTNKIKFHGFIPKSNIGQFYDKAHFLFLLSTNESFGHVLLESWCTNTIFIGSKIKVFEEIIIPEKNGLLVEVEKKEDIEKLVGIIKKMDQKQFNLITANAQILLEKYSK